MTITGILDVCEKFTYRVQVLTWKVDGTWYWKDHRTDTGFRRMHAAVIAAKKLRKDQVDRQRPGVRRLREGVRVIDNRGHAHWGEKDQPQG